MKDGNERKIEGFNFILKKLQNPICGIKGPLPIVNKCYEYKKRCTCKIIFSLTQLHLRYYLYQAQPLCTSG